MINCIKSMRANFLTGTYVFVMKVNGIGQTRNTLIQQDMSSALCLVHMMDMEYL